MDVYYIGDCLSYVSMRNPCYRDYEKNPYGTEKEATKPQIKSAYCLAKGNVSESKLRNRHKQCIHGHIFVGIQIYYRGFLV